MAKNRQVAVLFLLAMLLLSAVPTSLIFAAEDNNEDQDENDEKQNTYAIEHRAQKMLEIANRTATRIEHLIEDVLANDSLIAALENASLLDDFEGNVTLFEDAKDLLLIASEAIESGYYQDAVKNITEAMKTFREVYRAIFRITAKRRIAALRTRVIARGLLVAMRRALERVERLRNLALEDENITSLLDEAEQYLNITAAEEMLAEGNVTGVSHNLVKANHLINKAYLLLKEKARKWIWKRARGYLNNLNRTCERIMRILVFAKMKGINVTAVLEELGYQNVTEFREDLRNMIETAREKSESIRNLLKDLKSISQTLWETERALSRHMLQHRHQSGNERGQRGGGAGLGKGSGMSGQKGNSSNSSGNRGNRP